MIETRPDGLTVHCHKLNGRAAGFALCAPSGYRLYVMDGKRIVGATLTVAKKAQANDYLEGLGVEMRV